MQINAALEAFKLLCRDVGSAYSLAALKAVESSGQLIKLSIDPAEYHDADSFRKDYLIYTYLRKYEGGVDDERLTREAKSTYLSVDSACKEANDRLRSMKPLPFIRDGVSVDSVLFHAREKIRSVLGDCSPTKWVEHCEWGPGATASLDAESATVDKKVTEHLFSVTGSALKYATAYLTVDSTWCSARLRVPCEGPVSPLHAWFEICDDGRYCAVPKDAWKHRSIDIQPTFNLFLQKGVGRYIRGRLKRFGVNLDDQSRNQELAKEAYSCGYATIDLQHASDSVSTELVRQLLDEEWFTLLNDLRTKSTSIDGVSHRLHKFSAMGNGFTFELESLVFWALAWATRYSLGESGPIGVYGDDIVVSQSYAQPLVAVLECVGFSVNLEKSFLTGRFFESCGRHFFMGFDVTPVYQKEVISDLASCIRAHNRVLRWSIRGDDSFRWCDSVVRSSVSFFRRLSHTYTNQYGFRERSAFTGHYSRNVYVRVPTQPWWLEMDVGLIRLWYFPSDRDGIIRLSGLRASARKRRGDDYALYATSLRRGVVVENPFLGYVNPRGDGKTNLSIYRVYAKTRDVPAWI